DDTLGVVEGFLRSVRELEAIGDTSEDWKLRIRWLEGLISELWRHRGLFPGLPAVLETLALHDAISFFRARALSGAEKEASDGIWGVLTGAADEVPGLEIPADALKSARRQWRLRSPAEQELLKNVLPRFALSRDQVVNILSEKRH